MNLLVFVLFSVFCLDRIACTLNSAYDDNERQTYIVYMGELPDDTMSLMKAHHDILSETVGDELVARKSRIYSYKRSFNGFAARLLPHEAKLLSQKEGVLSVFPNKVQKLMTTRSWDFLGMTKKVKRNIRLETNMIVAVLDTGIWVDSPSFNDKGIGPPPHKWKGTCAKGGNFTGCNNKVIGAQYFDLGRSAPEGSPVDDEGHGTHTASTAGGVSVEGASLYGIAKGTARGAVPSARIASYKVCWGGNGCQDMDLLAAFDAAIADGVDVISLSIGGAGRSFSEDPIAIGAFHGLKKGVLTVCAAGNEGPYPATVQNVAPWIITVAATTIDRKFQNSGVAINTYVPKKKFYPLTNGEQAKNTSKDAYGDASECEYGTLNKNKVKGKIVYCQGTGGDGVILGLGGAGTIMSDEQLDDTAFPTIAAGTYVSSIDGQRIYNYINSTRSAEAVISKTRSVLKTDAPAVASFSSRGPQQLSANLLKPDIAAPGVNILAAYTKLTTVTGEEGDTRVVKYNIQSGTSMACPHVSGAAAYVKSFHPNWSPAAIKSALMTTSKRMKIKPEGAEFASGSGQVNPKTAVHPGLIYDINLVSYISFLCKQGYQDKEIALLTGSKKYNCSSVPRARGADGINYPSMHLQVRRNESVISAVFYRSVTNVGIGTSTYKAKVNFPKGVTIKVTPNVMTFNRPNQKKSFTVKVEGKPPRKGAWYLSGSLLWSDTKHNVRSPILLSSDTF
ncbi:Subtilisin-like serine endopeptidase family protein [Perilla frutescens var. hirtella]|uniref:Subtilisin-like serine endopeptidase family protein n=1 Tax=Perilla frutescens var. hirtella TaxID=608512 RepID=A0AAD4JPV0_PERFH|nr:Subtilisin-like serine endopeptidase family protein [Perilla frutescens var. hirtella]